MTTNSLFSAQALTQFIPATQIPSVSERLPNRGNSIRLVNLGPAVIFMSIGLGTQVATVPNTDPFTTCVPILFGADIVLSIPQSEIQEISVICNTGGQASLLVAVGEGQ